MKLIIMDLRIWAFLMVCISLSEAQRGINSLQALQPGKLQSSGKLSSQANSDGEDPRKAKIMKQINKVNDDGSYTFGYEADDGSFRVETRTKDGAVKGKYGYVDANGQLKVMEYAAGERTTPIEAEDSEEDAPKETKPTPAATPTRAPLPSRSPLIPRPSYAPRYVVRSTKSTSAALPPTFPPFKKRQIPILVRPAPSALTLPSIAPSPDQSVAAQTPSKVTQVNYNNNDEEEAEDEEDKAEGDDEGDKNVNNGQYFRAITQQPGRPGPGAGASRQPQTDGPRYVPTTQLGIGEQHRGGSPQGGSIYGQQQQFRPQDYSQGFGGPGPQGFTTPVIRQHQQPGSPGQRGPPQYSTGQGQSGLSPYASQGQSGPSPFSNQPGQSPYPGQPGQSPYSQIQQGPSPFGSPQGQYEEAEFDGNVQSSPQFGRGPNPNVQIQFRGSPNDISTQDKHQSQQQSPFPGAGAQSFPGFGAAPGSGRQFGGPAGGRQLGQGQQQYVPNVSLDGFSEDADEDGYVDELPKGAEGSLAQAQEKQGQAVKVGGLGGQRSQPDAYRPQVLGPQGVLQGGRVQFGQERQQPGRGGADPSLGPIQPGQGQNPFLSQGQLGQGPSPFLSQGQLGQGGQPQGQLSDEQLQQLLAQYQDGPGPVPQGQGQFLGQSQFGGGFPGQGSQGFPGQGQSQFLGGGRPGQGSQGQFLGQQSPQPGRPGQYIPGQGNQFSGFPQQQYNPQQQGQFLGQGQPGQGQFLGQQGPFLGQAGGQGQGLSSLGGSGGQGSQGGRPIPLEGSQFGQGSVGSQGGRPIPLEGSQFSQGSVGSQGGPQSAGVPFEFNPYAGLPGQSQGFSGQGFGGQGQGFPGQSSQGFPGQSQGFPGQSQGFLGQSQPQGFPGQSQGFPGQSQSFLGQPGQSQGFPSQGGQGQSFLGQGPSQGLSAQQGGQPIYQGGFPRQGQQQAGFSPSRYPGAIQGQQGQISQQLLSGLGHGQGGVQLGGGGARPVQSAQGAGGVFGAEARKVTSAAPETKTKTSK